MIYLHGSDARQQAIADTLSKLAGTNWNKRRSQARPGRPEAIGHATGTAAA